MSFLSRMAVTSVGMIYAVPGLAHPGHGMVGAHWHATDTALFVVAGLVAFVAFIWRDK